MKLVEMIQALVDGRTVRSRTFRYEYRLNGDVLEIKLPNEDKFKQASTPGVNIRERAQRMLDGETVVLNEGVRARMGDSCVELSYPSRSKSYSFGSDSDSDSDSDYYIIEGFDTSADIWDIVEEIE